MSSNDRDYILGTHDSEIARLGLQHRVWRPHMLEAWRRAGLASGARVLDVGAGPGFASIDLAEIVGPTGEVIAVERSARFAASARERAAGANLSHLHVHEIDLMNDPLPAAAFDIAWCRWVASFVTSPAVLAEKISLALRPGGRAIFHEYLDYGTWRYLPALPRVSEFVQQVMASWRAAGGEPDIADQLPALLAPHGVDVTHARPLLFTVRPADFMWEWPAAFVDVNLERLQSLGRVDATWVASVREQLRQATANPETLMVTPLVLELIAEKRL